MALRNLASTENQEQSALTDQGYLAEILAQLKVITFHLSVLTDTTVLPEDLDDTD